MSIRSATGWGLMGSVAMALAGPSGMAQAVLEDFVKTPDAAFSWKLKQKTTAGDMTIWDIDLVSQVWQGITWKHQLQVFLPRGVKPSSTMFLWNQGGKANIGSMAMAMELARKMKAPVAFLYGIPNQPLLGGKKEDTLIAETFVRYLKTGDDTWPLLFPMVKSLVRAMDALQEFARREWNVTVTHFVVSGASKRGWTTWLTGASDPRVKAIAPLVIDTLNMQAQLPHQLKSYGKYSEMIGDYTRRNLVPIPDSPRARKLWSMVDPWVYRAKLKMPIMIINGANDPYWAVDALNLYWSDIPGPKSVLYVPNAGHNLKQKHANGREDHNRVLNTLAAFSRLQIEGRALPKLEWRHSEEGDSCHLRIQAEPAPTAARLWVVDAPTRDFRRARWEEKPMAPDNGRCSATIELPAEGCRAFFAELDFRDAGLDYTLSTQVHVLQAKRAAP